MDEVLLDDKNIVVMKLLHYFITERKYNPIILQGAENEIWLENLDSDYKIIRIVSNHIHNYEQFEFDLYKTKHIVKKIKRKTLTMNMNVLSIFTDVRDSDNIISNKNYDCISIESEKDIEKFDNVVKSFPDIMKKLKFDEDGMQLFLKITTDINKKNKKDQVEAEDIFKPKKPIITNGLIILNIIIFVFMLLFDKNDFILNKFCVYGPYIVKGEYYRLVTGAFLHGNLFHLLFNCYALYVIGSQIESFYGKIKYLIIYFSSTLFSSLLSIALSRYASIGASGAIFGLMGAMLYFGLHYRVYLGSVIKSQIIPLILLNLFIGFLFSAQIDNFAHIGGLIGGTLISKAVGVKYKSTKSDMINGWILALILLVFLAVIANKFIV